MSSDDRTASGGGGAGADPLGGLRASARGWHSIQLAVLGFVGLCGVLKGPSSAPRGVRLVSGALVLISLALACCATALVGRVAWPLLEGGGATELRRAGRRLRTGLVLTFTAVTLVALAAASSWWPTRQPPAAQNAAKGEAAQALLSVETTTGSACGTPAPSEGGTLILGSGEQQTVVSLDEIITLRPVTSCP